MANNIPSRLKALNRPISMVCVSTYIPRPCGIATFTKDLTTAINVLNPQKPAEIIAMDRSEDNYNYPHEVKKIISHDQLESYHKAAAYINSAKYDLLNIQHEFGIFGGDGGEYVLSLASKVKKPIVTTLHTIPKNPTNQTRRIIRELASMSKMLTVISEICIERLVNIYKVKRSKVAFIHHGAPDFSFNDTHPYKKELKLENKSVISAINLISSNKGIEYVLDALPAVIKKHPKIVYLIIGITHPEVLKHEGERYRTYLEDKVKQLKLKRHVKFVNEYVPLETLIHYLRATDFYVTPYFDPDQTSSGTLAYAISAGKICISTPYAYARELLNQKRGVLVDFRNSCQISKAINYHLDHPKASLKMQKRVYTYGRNMTWPYVASNYLNLFRLVS